MNLKVGCCGFTGRREDALRFIACLHREGKFF